MSDKFTIIKKLRRFLQLGPISSTTFDEKLKIIQTYYGLKYQRLEALTEASQKSLAQTFHYNKKAQGK